MENFEPNKVVIVSDGKSKVKSMYSSLLYKDKERDHLSLNNISKIIINSDYIDVFKFESFYTSEYNSYFIKYNFELDSLDLKKVRFQGNFDSSYDDELNYSYKFDTQTLVDTFAQAIYEHKGIEEYEFISNLKKEAYEEITKKMFNNNFYIIFDKEYYHTSKIKCNDKVIGISNSFTISNEYNNKKDILKKISLKNIVSYTSLKNMNNMSIEISNSNETFILKDLKIINGFDGILKDYDFLFANVDVGNEEVSTIESINEDQIKVLDKEEVFNILSENLTKKEEIFNITKNKKNIFEDIFDL